MEQATLRPAAFTAVDAKPALRTTAEAGSIILIPTPSGDPEDPLNWSAKRKVTAVALVCLASFSGYVTSVASQLAYPVQAEQSYHIPVIEASYSVSAAIAGLATGAFFITPFSQLFGKWFLIFWSLIGSLACAIWAAFMTAESDFVPFIISRLLAGLCGSVPPAVGGGLILDICFLHQRGRAYFYLQISALFGATVGPTFSGFIAGSTSWTVCFWWTVPVIAISAVLVLVLAEETEFDRSLMGKERMRLSYARSRVALFVPGMTTKKAPSAAIFMKNAAAPYLIAVSPVTILVGVFSMLVFAWGLLNAVLGAVFLQTPRSEGGYGFTATQNGAFSFVNWVANIAAELLGYSISDKVPLWICRRFHSGLWQPELRLWLLFIPVGLTTVGMAIAGTALANHYHFMVYTLGVFFVETSNAFTSGVASTYLAECFTGHATATTLVMAFYRLAFGLCIPFFVMDWAAKVGINWVFGTAAFMTLAISSFVCLLLWQGPRIRTWMLVKSLNESEDGRKLFED